MSRQNKSQRVAGDLKRISGRTIQAKNPYASELEEAAKHIEWLELVITGISFKERNTIAKIERHRKMLQKKVDAKDTTINILKAKHKMLNEQHKNYKKKSCRAMDELRKKRKVITQDQRHVIEKKFIKDLQTGFEKGRTISNARWEGRSSNYRDSTSATHGGWHQN